MDAENAEVLGNKRKVDAMEDVDIDDEVADEGVDQEYRVWKKNAPLLYDVVLTHCLTWPTLTCDWLPDRTTPPGADYTVQKLIVGTQTLDGNDNYLMIMQAKIPKPDSQIDASKFEDSAETGTQSETGRLAVTTMMCHPGEVNRALHNPHSHFQIATKTVSGEVLVFDYSQHPSKPKIENSPLPLLTLTGHRSEGFALAWAPLTPGLLASGAEDALVLLWDTKSKTTPLQSLAHSGSVEAVSFHFQQADLLASAGAESYLWDLRAGKISLVLNYKQANCISFCEHNEHLLAVAGAGKSVGLFDLRKPGNSIFSLEGGHEDEITNLNWSPFSETILATSGNDRRVVIWDLSKIGEELTTDEARDGPPELLFVHGGHTGRLCDFSWTRDDSWTIASAADDNVLQIWQMAQSIYLGDERDTENY